jgi:proline iminopeptidase
VSIVNMHKPAQLARHRTNRLCVLVAALFLAVALWQRAHGQIVGEPEWYLPIEGNCRLAVKEVGNAGPLVVVLHGGFGAEYSYLVEPLRLLANKYHLVFYDQRGSFRSPCASEHISVQQHVNDLERLRAELRADKVLLIGHSRGAYLALDYLQRYPDRVAGLVLLAPASLRTPSDAEDQALLKQSDDAARAFLARPEIAAQLKKEGLHKNQQQMTAKEKTDAWRVRFAGANMYHVELWRQMEGGQVYFNDKSGTAAAKTLPAAWDFTPVLASTSCPVAIILGDHDIVDFGSAMNRKWIGNLPRARLTVLKNAGHNAWLDTPEEFQQALWQAMSWTTSAPDKEEAK